MRLVIQSLRNTVCVQGKRRPSLILLINKTEIFRREGRSPHQIHHWSKNSKLIVSPIKNSLVTLLLTSEPMVSPIKVSHDKYTVFFIPSRLDR